MDDTEEVEITDGPHDGKRVTVPRRALAFTLPWDIPGEVVPITPDTPKPVRVFAHYHRAAPGEPFRFDRTY